MSSIRKDSQLSESTNGGRWSTEEHRLFLEGLALYGKEWKKIEEIIKTRDSAQIRSHAQKFFLRMTKEYKRVLVNSMQNSQTQQEISVITVSSGEDSPKTKKSTENELDSELEKLESLERVKKMLEMTLISMSLQSSERKTEGLKAHNSFFQYLQVNTPSLQTKGKRKLADLVDFSSKKSLPEAFPVKKRISFQIYKGI